MPFSGLQNVGLVGEVRLKGAEGEGAGADPAAVPEADYDLVVSPAPHCFLVSTGQCAEPAGYCTVGSGWEAIGDDPVGWVYLRPQGWNGVTQRAGR
ncbi:hypothetical protein GCM10017559_03580 [Streptosporangium longisporum]|uniref:Uncharacterized protein n=1 Tax=Streptosporangium longisporum TaxID=46187 RepID=A0ABP6K9K4_9ACTN